MISGYVMDPLGEKMSKSKGNIIEPQAIMVKYSADAMRYWSGGCKLGEDIAYQEKELVTGDKFVTKFWNAAKFTAMHLKNADLKKLAKKEPSEMIDKWIQHRLAVTIEEATMHFDSYEYSRAKEVIEKFFWTDFCDNYLELSKQRLYEPKKPEEKESAQAVVYKCLSALVRLFAPFTPFITEEIYHAYLHASEGFPSVHVSGWPKPMKKSEEADKIGKVVVAVLGAVRKKKSENKLSMKAPVKKIVVESEVDIAPALGDLQATTCAVKIEKGKGKEEIIKDVKATIEF